MDLVPVKLRLMNGSSYSPRETCDFLLPVEGVITEIYKKNRREVGCRPENREDHDRSKVHVLARIHAMKESLFVEPFVDNVSVHAPFLHKDAKGDQNSIPITHNSHYNNYRTYAFLRPDDSIHFLDHDLTVAVMSCQDSTTKLAHVEAPIITSGDAAESEVIQVESSNATSHERADAQTTTHVDGDESTDTENEEDLDRNVQSGRSLVVPVATPPTPRIGEPTTEATIKETPNTRTYSFSNDGDQPYSTARDQSTTDAEGDVDVDDSGIILVDPNSPSRRAQYRSTLSRSQGRTYVEAPRDEVESSKHPEDLSTSDLPNTDPIDLSEDITADQHALLLTSEPLDEHEVASTAAKRTLPQPSSKRKSDDISAEEFETPLDNKKPRLSKTPQSTNEVPDDSRAIGKTSATKALDVDKEFVETSPNAKTAMSEKGKLRKKSSTVKRSSRATENLEDEVIVVHKPSPEVVVRKQRKSETLQSSNAASSLPLAGKVPKILLSSDSAVHSNAAVKNWLRKIGASITDAVPTRGTHFVCVVTKKHSLKSAKVLHSLAMGKVVVTDNWITESRTAGELLDPAEYVHETLEKEITHDRSKVFAGKHLFFTAEVVKQYKDGWVDIQNVAKEAGAREVDKVEFSVHCLRDSDEILLFGAGPKDPDASQLIHEYGRKVYSKEFFTHIVISGELKGDDDDFELKASVPTKKKKGRR